MQAYNEFFYCINIITMQTFWQQHDFCILLDISVQKSVMIYYVHYKMKENQYKI